MRIFYQRPCGAVQLVQSGDMAEDFSSAIVEDDDAAPGARQLGKNPRGAEVVERREIAGEAPTLRFIGGKSEECQRAPSMPLAPRLA